MLRWQQERVECTTLCSFCQTVDANIGGELVVYKMQFVSCFSPFKVVTLLIGPIVPNQISRKSYWPVVTNGHFISCLARAKKRQGHLTNNFAFLGESLTSVACSELPVHAVIRAGIEQKEANESCRHQQTLRLWLK